MHRLRDHRHGLWRCAGRTPQVTGGHARAGPVGRGGCEGGGRTTRTHIVGSGVLHDRSGSGPGRSGRGPGAGVHPSRLTQGSLCTSRPGRKAHLRVEAAGPHARGVQGGGGRRCGGGCDPDGRIPVSLCRRGSAREGDDPGSPDHSGTDNGQPVGRQALGARFREGRGERGLSGLPHTGSGLLAEPLPCPCSHTAGR